jgi:hypothetical protein
MAEQGVNGVGGRLQAVLLSMQRRRETFAAGGTVRPLKAFAYCESE